MHFHIVEIMCSPIVACT